jgi:membrane protease YdiL (CAAX protease family)
MKQQWRVPIVSIGASTFLIIYHYQGQPSFFDVLFLGRFLLNPAKELYPHLYSFGAAFLLLGVLPAIIVCALWNEGPSDWGLALGQKKLTSSIVSVALFIIMLPVLAYASKLPLIMAWHPLSRLAAWHQKALIIYEIALFLYLVGWEFFFRGFLLFGLNKKFGDGAIFIQSVPYAIMYLGRPQIEALGAIPAGIALGYLASRSGSVWYGIILHWTCALTLDLFVICQPF